MRIDLDNFTFLILIPFLLTYIQKSNIQTVERHDKVKALKITTSDFDLRNSVLKCSLKNTKRGF